MSKFSVIIASVNGLPMIDECLAALETSRRGHDVEVLVTDATDEKTRRHIELKFPDVHLIKVSGRPGIPRMRAIGMREATGDFLIVTEDHCIAPGNWFSEFAKAHESGYEVVGGAVENGSTARLVDWAVFLCEYSAFMPAIPEGEVDFVAGNNVSYRRELLEGIDEPVKSDFWEYFLQAELKRQGVKFLSVPAIQVVHKKEFGFFYFLGQRFHYSRSFSAMRRRRSNLFGRLFYLAYAPLSVVHLTARIVRNVMKKKTRRRELCLSFPLLAVFMCSYAAGELFGQLFGSGDSLAKVE